MLKLAIISLVFVSAWAANDYPYSLFKLYPISTRQVQFLKNLATSKQENLPPVFLTPLGQGKAAYVLISGDSHSNFSAKFQQEHIPMKFVDVSNIKSSVVNNKMHEPAELPPPRSSSDREGYIISSPRVTNWGVWGDYAQCSPGEKVVGMRLKTEAYQSRRDDTALNAIQLLCAKSGSHEYTTIKSLEGGWGDWGRTFYCANDGQVKGFQLRSEAYQGNGDDTAANNLRVFCTSSPEMIEGDGQDWGSWSERQDCLNGQAVTGFRTQVEPYQGSGDDTALNNVDMVCHDIIETACVGGGGACPSGDDSDCCSKWCYMGTCTHPRNQPQSSGFNQDSSMHN